MKNMKELVSQVMKSMDCEVINTKVERLRYHAPLDKIEFFGENIPKGEMFFTSKVKNVMFYNVEYAIMEPQLKLGFDVLFKALIFSNIKLLKINIAKGETFESPFDVNEKGENVVFGPYEKDQIFYRIIEIVPSRYNLEYLHELEKMDMTQRIIKQIDDSKEKWHEYAAKRRARYAAETATEEETAAESATEDVQEVEEAE